MSKTLIFFLGMVSGVVSAASVVVFLLYSVSKVEDYKVAIYKKGQIRIGGESYFVFGAHPFYDMEIVDGQFELKKGKAFGNPTTFAVYKPLSKN